MNKAHLSAVTYTSFIRLSIPVILANMAVPLLGLIDTAIIGHTGSVSDLGAIALGSMVFNFIYWAFGFLRMGTTGFVAQAAGAGDGLEVRAAYGRGLLFGVVIGVGLVLLQLPLGNIVLSLLDGSERVESEVKVYWDVRIWAAPATLMIYVVLGVLIGLGQTRKLLWIQLGLNTCNVLLDCVFVIGFDLGVRGVALGTLIAEWICALAGLWVVARHFHGSGSGLGRNFWSITRLTDGQALRKMLSTNTDIMLRTLFLLVGFAFFVNQGASFGDAVLAANHILLQFISFSAFFLDGFAFATESVVGQAIGARRRDLFDRAIGISTKLAAATAAILTVLLWVFAEATVATLTSIPAVRDTTSTYLPYAAVYVLVSFAAFQFDGIFIGAMRSRAMRNASFISLSVFLTVYFLITHRWDNQGLWMAFVIYVLARSATLGWYYPALRASI